MKKSVLLVLSLFFSLSMLSYSKNEFGIVYDEDFIKIGVTKENLTKAKELMGKASSEFKILALEKQKLEIEANQLVLDGAEKNLQKLDEIFDKMGDIESTIYKSKVRSQISMYKYISKEQYLKAREIAVTRIKEEQLKSEAEPLKK
ncbi:MAG: hypothetical protein KBE73_04805 [Fusobacteriaceae bacterium]|jgi:hypothetical protein|nr:hypothetical protein [Fusobacteriaceae bacterium]MBP6322927.1 hypothetical protein [Fusobacteriaceae bacterium]MBP9510440.1 hypothetical protein [Fusobacteriaceae bacterium]